MSNQVAKKVVTAQPKISVMGALAAKLEVDPSHLMEVLKKTVFKECRTNEEFIAMCMVANKYGLDPITKEIYAFPNKKTGAVIPVVGYDGWQKLANRNSQYDGVEFEEAEDGTWCKCRIWRKDRSHPTEMTEWLEECVMDTIPWKKYPRRMLRNKAFNQCARAAFNLAGIFDPDEAERIVQSEEAAITAQIEAAPKQTQLGVKRKSAAQLLAKPLPKEEEELPDDEANEVEPVHVPVDAPADGDDAAPDDLPY